MDPIKNPFTPGAGCPPHELVGREAVLEEARILLGRTLRKKPEKSMLLTGLRGVGKTVLLNAIEQEAQSQGYKTIFFEVTENQTMGHKLIPALRNLFFELDRIEGSKEMIKRGLMILRNFIGSLKLNYGEFGVELDPLPGIADSGNPEIDLPDLFLAVAEAARAKNSGVALLIDEIQLLRQEELAGLIMAMHKLQQKQAPFVLVAAGLPTLPRLAGEAKSYAERLFSYPIIGQLSKEDCDNALQTPVSLEHADFSQDALEAIYRYTQGFPYFLQEWGYQVWKVASHPYMTRDDVQAAKTLVTSRLDTNFFRVRYDRLTDGEKRFMHAMATGTTPCKSADVAEKLNMKPTAATPIRASLIRKGMIFSPRHGLIDYSVPLFGEFLNRTEQNSNL